MPIPVVPLVLAGGVALLVAATSKKKTSASQTTGSSSSAAQVYAQAMDPGNQDIAALESALAYLRSYGSAQQVAAVTAKLEAVKAQQGYEQAAGGPPNAANVTDAYNYIMTADAATVQHNSGALVYAYSIVAVYGTQAQKDTAYARMVQLGISVQPPSGVFSSAPAPAPGPTIPPGVVVDDEDDDIVMTTPPDVPSPIGPAPATVPPLAVPAAVPAAIPAVIPTALPVPVPAAAPPPLATEETAPYADPNGTVALARDMIERESRSGWKTALQPQIKAWQAAVGIDADGKFGIGAAEKMAEEVGILPRVRYFPRDTYTKQQGLDRYAERIGAVERRIKREGKTAHAAALRTSIAREGAESWGTDNPPAIPAGDRQEQLSQLAEMLGEEL